MGQTLHEVKRDVWLIWELNPQDKTQCLRAIDESEVILKSHLHALRDEAELHGRASKFFTEQTKTNHAYGHNDMKAANIIVRNIRKS